MSLTAFPYELLKRIIEEKNGPSCYRHCSNKHYTGQLLQTLATVKGTGSTAPIYWQGEGKLSLRSPLSDAQEFVNPTVGSALLSTVEGLSAALHLVDSAVGPSSKANKT